MGTVHQLLAEKGKQEAIASGTVDREIVEAAARYMSDEEFGLGLRLFRLDPMRPAPPTA